MLRLSFTPEILLQLSSMELGLAADSRISELFLEVGGVAKEAPELLRESAGEGMTEAGESWTGNSIILFFVFLLIFTKLEMSCF